MGEDAGLRRVTETNDWAITWERNRTENIESDRKLKPF